MNPPLPYGRSPTSNDFSEAHADLHALLLHVESLGLPDGWIGAGFIRNSVWDVLHGRDIDVSRLDDVIVSFFDPAIQEGAGSRDRAPARHPGAGIPWSVKNQARMHLRNGDAPYRDTFDAVAHWAETATAIAARSRQWQGRGDGAPRSRRPPDLIVRPTPLFGHKMDVYRERVARKDWPARWPKLTVLMTWEEAYPTLTLPSTGSTRKARSRRRGRCARPVRWPRGRR